MSSLKTKSLDDFRTKPNLWVLDPYAALQPKLL